MKRYVLWQAAEHLPREVILSGVRATRSKPAPYRYEPTLAARECWHNVNRVVSEQGGEAVFGWSTINIKYAVASILEAIRMAAERGVPTAIGPKDVRGIRGIEMETHCIWRSPGGELIDVTPTQGGEKCSFVPDVRVPPIACHLLVFNGLTERQMYANVVAAVPPPRPGRWRTMEIDDSELGE